MTLPEDDETIFELFVDWLYHQRYDVPPTPNDPENPCDRFMQPVQLFVLADKYGVRNLKNVIVSQIHSVVKMSSDVPKEATIAYAYEHTSQNSTIRKVLADMMAYYAGRNWFERAVNQTWLRDHHDISMDVMVKLAKRAEDAYGGPFYRGVPEEYVEKEEESEE